MNKKLLITTLLPLMLLTACQISVSNDEHEEGFDDGDQPVEEVIEYYTGYGDTLVTDNYTAHTFNINNTAMEQGADIPSTDGSSIIALFNDTDSCMSSVTTADYVALGVGGLKIGHLNTSIKGILDIAFIDTFSFTLAEVYCQPRSAIISGESGTTESIDSPVALSVNDSKYVKVDSAFDDIASMTETKCSYQLSAASAHLKLKVLGQRLIVTKVVLYSANASESTPEN